MKAISLWQPWASLLACGAKKYETRSWATSYRGPIAIHASKRPFDTDVYFDRELHPFVNELNLPNIYSFGELPYGCIIATAEIVGCYRIYDTVDNGIHIVKCPNNKYDFDKVEYISVTERAFGDWTEGRFAWEFKNMLMLPSPIPAKGRQRLWNWEASL